jgi:hypothetical protein
MPEFKRYFSIYFYNTVDLLVDFTAIHQSHLKNAF